MAPQQWKREQFDRTADDLATLEAAAQTLEDNPDGSLTVRFEAGGKLDMARHLMRWGIMLRC